MSSKILILTLPLIILNFVSCSEPPSKLNLAGGDVEAGKTFDGSVYVQVHTKTLNDTNGPIMKNVGTFLDLSDHGIDSHYILVMSLADAFEMKNGMPTLPAMKSISLEIFAGDRKEQSFKTDDLMFQMDGSLDGGFSFLAVGVKTQGSAKSSKVHEKVTGLTEKLTLAADLMHKNTNYRNDVTSYLMLGFPKNSSKYNIREHGIDPYKVILAEDRPSESELNQGELQLIGYGDTSSVNKDITVQSETRRNSTAVLALNDLKAEGGITTIFRSSTIGSEQIVRELWEIKGSGLCGSSDGVSYDTGATLLYRESPNAEFKFVGFGVKSSVIKGDMAFKRAADCSKDLPEDMATLIVSPSELHFNKLKTVTQ